MIKSFSTAAVLALSMAVPNAAHAVSIQNASFEQFNPGLDPAGFFTTLSGNQLPGWTIDSGTTVDHIGGYWQASPGGGSNSLDLNGNGVSAIQQTLSGLSAGTEYIVSFFISGNPDNGFGPNAPNPKVAQLTLGGTSAMVSYTLTAANSRSNMLWEQVSYSFVADNSGEALLRLASVSGNAFGLALDNFSITAVPEPATWMMMIMGFGIAGMAIRRRKPMIRQTVAFRTA